MKKFNLVADVIISIYTEVEAETLEKAKEIAREREIESAEFRAEEQAKENWISDEYDGIPQNIRLG